MTNIDKQRFPNFANLAIAILESKVKDVIGDEAIATIKKPLLEKELIGKLYKASERAEKRFVAENPNEEITNALSLLPITDLPSVKSAIVSFYNDPTNPEFLSKLKSEIMLVLPKNYPGDKVVEAAAQILVYLWEELTAIPEIRERLTAISIIRTEKYSSVTVELLRSIDGRLAELKKIPEPDSVSEILIHHNLNPRGAFIGRRDEINQILSSLEQSWPTVIIYGFGGIGKTALALECGHALLHESEKSSVENIRFHNIVWVSARERNIILDDVLDLIARTCNQLYITRLSLENKISAIKELLTTKRTLIIVDNYESIEDQALDQFLINVIEPSKVLITSRRRLNQYSSAKIFAIKELSQEEAFELIDLELNRLGLSDKIDSKSKYTHSIFDVIGGIPLAIKWTLGLLVNGGQSLGEIKSLISEAKGALFESLFNSVWGLLSENQKTILMTISNFPASMDKGSIAAITGVNKQDVDNHTAKLVELSLLEPNILFDFDTVRFSLHPLTRQFALSNVNQTQSFYNEVVDKASNYYLDLTNRLPTNHDWRNRLLVIPDEDIRIIMGLSQMLYRLNKWQEILSLRERIWYFLSIKGYWRDRIDIDNMAINAADKVGNIRLRPWVLVHTLSWITFKQGNPELSAKYCQEALDIYQKLNDEKEIAFTKVRLGLIEYELKHSKRAETLYQEALTVAQEMRDNDLILWILGNIGDVYCQVGEFEQGRSKYSEGLDIARTLGWPVRIGLLGNKLAYSFLMEEKFDLAVRYFEECINVLDKSEGSHIDIFIRAKLGLCMAMYKIGKNDIAKRLYTDVKGTIASLEIREEYIEKIISELSTAFDAKSS